MKNEKLTVHEKNELWLCVTARIAFIETGDPVMRAVDVQRRLAVTRDPGTVRQLSQMLRPLSPEQRRLIVMLEELATRIAEDRL